MPPKVTEIIKEQQEQAIFKEFEELGYHITKGLNSIKVYHKKNSKKIMIWNDKTYIANTFLTIKEHQLLHRLFKLWGWLDEQTKTKSTRCRNK